MSSMLHPDRLHTDQDVLGYYRGDIWISWTIQTRERLPRRASERLQFVARIDDEFKVWWWNIDTPVIFPLSDDFPTELDIARLCVECP